MRHPSLIKRIENSAKARPETWVSGGEYEKLSIAVGYKASHADRRCRDLVKAGVLEKKMEHGHIWYRYREPWPTSGTKIVHGEPYEVTLVAPKKEQKEEKQKVEAGVQKALV